MRGDRRWPVSLSLVASAGSAPQALREAAAADRCETVGDALATTSEQAVTTALLALETAAAVREAEDEAGQPMAELVTMDGAVRAAEEAKLVAVVVGEASSRRASASAYREGVGCGVVVRASAIDGVIEPVAVALLAVAVATLRGEVQPGGVGAGGVDDAALVEIERAGREALTAVFAAIGPGAG